jgi:hypothetical protein
LDYSIKFKLKTGRDMRKLFKYVQIL